MTVKTEELLSETLLLTRCSCRRRQDIEQTLCCVQLQHMRSFLPLWELQHLLHCDPSDARWLTMCNAAGASPPNTSRKKTPSPAVDCQFKANSLCKPQLLRNQQTPRLSLSGYLNLYLHLCGGMALQMYMASYKQA